MSYDRAIALWDHWQLSCVLLWCSTGFCLLWCITLYWNDSNYVFLWVLVILVLSISAFDFVVVGWISLAPRGMMMTRLTVRLLLKTPAESNGLICLLQLYGAPKLHHTTDAEESWKKQCSVVVLYGAWRWTHWSLCVPYNLGYPTILNIKWAKWTG